MSSGPWQALCHCGRILTADGHCPEERTWFPADPPDGIIPVHVQLRAVRAEAAEALAAFAEMKRLAAGTGYDEAASKTFDRLLGAVLLAVDREAHGHARLGSATGAIAALKAAYLRACAGLAPVSDPAGPAE